METEKVTVPNAGMKCRDWKFDQPPGQMRGAINEKP